MCYTCQTTDIVYAKNSEKPKLDQLRATALVMSSRMSMHALGDKLDRVELHCLEDEEVQALIDEMLLTLKKGDIWKDKPTEAPQVQSWQKPKQSGKTHWMLEKYYSEYAPMTTTLKMSGAEYYLSHKGLGYHVPGPFDYDDYAESHIHVDFSGSFPKKGPELALILAKYQGKYYSPHPYTATLTELDKTGNYDWNKILTMGLLNKYHNAVLSNNAEEVELVCEAIYHHMTEPPPPFWSNF